MSDSTTTTNSGQNQNIQNIQRLNSQGQTVKVELLGHLQDQEENPRYLNCQSEDLSTITIASQARVNVKPIPVDPLAMELPISSPEPLPVVPNSVRVGPSSPANRIIVHQQPQQIPQHQKFQDVRVDNWGNYCLQRLQVMYDRGDFCDLTMQFSTGHTLKVHRVVVNLFTEYFANLERKAGLTNGVLIVPKDMEYQSMVTIIKFFYSGKLEIRGNTFNEVHRTVKLMNVTILIDILDADAKNMGRDSSDNTTNSTTKRRTGRPKVSRIMKEVQEGEALLKEMGHERGPDEGKIVTRSVTRAIPRTPVKGEDRSGSSPNATPNSTKNKKPAPALSSVAKCRSRGGRGRRKKSEAEAKASENNGGAEAHEKDDESVEAEADEKMDTSDELVPKSKDKHEEEKETKEKVEVKASPSAGSITPKKAEKKSNNVAPEPKVLTPSKEPTPTPKEKQEPVSIKAASPAPVKPASLAPVKSASPAPAKSGSPAPMKSASPGPVKSASPAPMKSASPGTVKSASPSPMKSASPGPVKSTSPAPMKSASPAPVKSASRTPEKKEGPVSSPESVTPTTNFRNLIASVLSCVEVGYKKKEILDATPAAVNATPEKKVAVQWRNKGGRWFKL